VARHPWRRLLSTRGLVLSMVGLVGGGLAWCWKELARLVTLQPPMRLPLRDAARAWQLVLHGGWEPPAAAFRAPAERAAVPGPAQRPV